MLWKWRVNGQKQKGMRLLSGSSGLLKFKSKRRRARCGEIDFQMIGRVPLTMPFSDWVLSMVYRGQFQFTVTCRIG
jgi:hypothetical protein